MKNLIDTYLNHSSWDLKENSNFQYSYNSLRNYIASNTIKTYWLKKVFSKRECERHISGDFHIHDLDNLCPYCIGWDTFTILQDKDKSSLKTIENGMFKSYAPQSEWDMLAEVLGQNLINNAELRA